MRLVAVAKEKKRDMEGNLSVLSTPDGTPGTFSGKGRSTMEAAVSERELAMKGRLAGVVKTVTARRRRRRKRAKWRRGMVWPLDMKGNKTAWLCFCGVEFNEFEPTIFSYSLIFFLHTSLNETVYIEKRYYVKLTLVVGYLPKKKNFSGRHLALA